MRQVLRNERKFLIGAAEFMAKKHLLRQLLREDPHNGPEGYLIRSLYFDTEYDGDFFDKEFGLEVRKKLRLRLYDPCGDFALLEMKQKQGTQQRKRSLRLRREDAQRMIQCDYTPPAPVPVALCRRVLRPDADPVLPAPRHCGLPPAGLSRQREQHPRHL